jgi:signal transduction histidine kinase
MIGYAKFLKSKLTEPQLQEAADIIQTEGERCNQILQQMLRFARNDPQEKRPYSLTEVVQSCLLLLKSEAKTHQHSIHSEIQDGFVLIGSPQQIQQVLINLLMNAMQASPSGSTISLKAESDGSWLSITVVDQGGGIPKSIQHRIFDPFFTTKSGSEGTGLGLSVAREIIQEQGGELNFVTEDGRGTSFTIRLPLPKDTNRASS